MTGRGLNLLSANLSSIDEGVLTGSKTADIIGDTSQTRPKNLRWGTPDVRPVEMASDFNEAAVREAGMDKTTSLDHYRIVEMLRKTGSKPPKIPYLVFLEIFRNKIRETLDRIENV